MLSALSVPACRSEPIGVGPTGATVDAAPGATADLGSSADLARRAPDLADPGASCGGFAGTPCSSGLYCEYPLGSFCGGNDSLGTCVHRPKDCVGANGKQPVCGCDGQTYADDCHRQLAGTSVAHEGACQPTSFACGAKTCNATEYCEQGCSGIGSNPPPGCKPIPDGCLQNPTCGCIAPQFGGPPSPPGGPGISCEPLPGGGVKVTYSGCA